MVSVLILLLLLLLLLRQINDRYSRSMINFTFIIFLIIFSASNSIQLWSLKAKKNGFCICPFNTLMLGIKIGIGQSKSNLSNFHVFSNYLSDMHKAKFGYLK